ncbi:DUF4132 domain-containing protein [Parasediminibacterium sp. JCM 36343]|uniref:DUF4132 domain-containing protein n=1 Tax=Parasediminibacterium sp. JCM 36343 TaxID=3374279 RepID=UPI003979B51B
MGFFDFLKKAAQTIPPIFSSTVAEEIIEQAYRDYKDQNINYWDIKPHTSTAFTEGLLKLNDKQKVAFILEAVKQCHKLNSNRTSWSSQDKNWVIYNIWNAYMQHLLRTKILMDDDDITTILEAFDNYSLYSSKNVLHWPVTLLITQIERQCKQEPASPILIKILNNFKEVVRKSGNNYNLKDTIKVIEKIDNIIFIASNNETTVKPTWFMGDDPFATYANEYIKQMPEAKQQLWFTLMLHSQRGSGSSPSAKFLNETRQAVKDLGDEAFKLQMNEWFHFITALKEEITEHVNVYNGREYRHHSSHFLASPNIDMIKGFVWMCTPFHNKTTLLHIAQLAERCFRKIPGKGPAAAAIGNACIYVLANVKGLDGVGHLSRLRLRIKQNTTQALIEKYLNKAAAEQGVSIHEIEDLAVDDYGLTNAERSWDFDGYTATLRITGSNKTTFSWYKPDGSLQKAVPSFVKEKHATKLKKVKELIKQVELTVSAQRDRIDRMLKIDRTFTWQQFTTLYFNHGLMRYLTNKLIWSFEQDGQKQAIIFLNEKWVHPQGELMFAPNDSTIVKLWHPVFEPIANIQAWRTFLIEQQIIQPIKQAFREVYLLTDAEINTRTYSNRMAAHILKQHQFNSLAKLRGWKYSLMGAYDDGRSNESASLILPEVSLRAEYWINEINADDAFNETGIWLYISTDQVRFVNTSTNEVVALIDVPPLVLSEVMRDVDLFVGVASVGNDPAWRDNGGLPAYRDYWQSYSFGELTEVAKTRKTILERLVPRLKIASVCSIQDKFLVVKGKLRTYKIHIGSTNILMEPNDQYLCIVPDRSSAGTATPNNVFLPFEGDNGISLIISKALLLAADDAITDTSITSQIKRK